LRQNPHEFEILKGYYREHPADFICDWGTTYDPRNVGDRLAVIPFLLFDKQREWVDVVIRKWKNKEPLITEKSRDGGFTWLAIALSCTLCLHYEGLAVGFGSRKAEYVDKKGTLKPILPKGRMFMRNLPEEFRGGYEEWRDAPEMRINFPSTGSLIGGEGGDDIGRGDRTSLYIVDESSHIPHAELIDASLSATTNCRIDVSSVRGMNNAFAKKRWEGKIEVFVFDWHEDPRKDQAWYEKQCAELDPVVVAQEIDRDYQASLEGIIIPGPWVRAALDACKKLGIAPAGEKWLALDVADEGKDKNALIGGQGIEVTHAEEFSGKNSDIHATVERSFRYADEHGFRKLRYDADGLGAGVRGAARVLNEQRVMIGQHQIEIEAFRGSEAVVDPEGVVEGTIGFETGDAGRTNEDYYLNRKAQGWGDLSRKFLKTYRRITEGKECDTDEMISFRSDSPHLKDLLHKLTTETSQPTRQFNAVGKMLVVKTPKGMKSPNLSDGLMMGRANLGAGSFEITQAALDQIRKANAARGRRRRA
jgi:phage terminase large subunit